MALDTPATHLMYYDTLKLHLMRHVNLDQVTKFRAFTVRQRKQNKRPMLSIKHRLEKKSSPRTLTQLDAPTALCVMNEISILGKPYVDHSRQETAQIPVGSNPGPPEIDDPKQEEQKPANLPSVNAGGLKSTLETLESKPDPPKTNQVTQSGQEPANLLNYKPKLTSYSETCQSSEDNSPNNHQIAANLALPKIQTYAEVVACLKEVKAKPTVNSANNHQQLPVFCPEWVVQSNSSGGIVNSGGGTNHCHFYSPEKV
ncbi:hypothetical protein DSO57_1021075 [Entomophthora muscae]|uniref:Uncharacterized protein n=1 Tax=Entomophthora muscae TaxID=34485 RepID=A0ACC2SSG7_9FUNG|nr:hypothetical protein DSO57_1021075 [Entomophthora muscae]